jgi:hypothetical protein
MADPNTTELRIALPREEVSVLDGYCAGTGQDRTQVVRRILREWSAAKLHEAMIVMRVAGSNPPAPEDERKPL